MMTKVLSLSVLVVIIVGTFIATMNQKKAVSITPEITFENPRKVYVGVWVGGFYDNDTKKLNTEVVTNFEKQIDKKMAIANIYSEWSYLQNKDLLTVLNKISDNGWVPMISSNPYFFEGCKPRKDSLYKTIASGACDEFLQNVASNLRSYNKPVMLRFAWEMNLPDMYWSVDKLKSNPEEFVGAWRHFHTVLKEENADNVVWVLSFNTSSANTIPYAQLYPGDEYVDWVAIDGYNWGVGPPWGGWTNFNGVFVKSYKELTAITKKPVMLSEVNSAERGGNKAEWLTDMLEIQIPQNYPQIEAIIFFNENKTEGEKVDWRIDKSPEYSDAVKKGLNTSLYRSSFP